MLSQEKSELRARLKALRDALPPEDRALRSARACARVLELPELALAKLVAVYAAKGSELDPAAIAEALWRRGCTVLYPRAEPKLAVLDFVVVKPGDTLVVGAYGVREPRGRPHDVRQADLVIVPGLAFDASGGRLGFGAGYYDRALMGFRSTSVGLCYDVQLLPAVPRDEHDCPVKVVITESRTLRAKKA
jgi:5-formyltetrahydrofolate cyclo-ligase